MEMTQEEFDGIKHLLPIQRGNVEVENLTFLRALQYMAENGCRWRALPKHFGKWYTIYQRFRRWITKGVFDRIEKAQQLQALDIKRIKALSLDSSYVKVHPDGTGAPNKKERNLSARVAAVGRQKSTPSSPMKTCRLSVVCPQDRQATIPKGRS
jgi:transposase